MSENDNRRRCWYCEDGILIWGADHDCEPDETFDCHQFVMRQLQRAVPDLLG